MKKFYLLCAAALCVAACQKPQGETPLEPDVELKSLEVTANTFSFTIAASSADKAAYVCLEADAVAPSVDDILSDGTSVDVSGEPVTVKLDELTAETSYVVYAAASNAESVMQQPETLAFSTTVDWYADVTSTSTLAWYFGYDEDAGGDNVVLSLCSGSLDEYSAMPYGEGELLRLYLYTDQTSVENPSLAPGTYELVETVTGPFQVLGGDYGSIFAVSTDEGWMQIGYESGTVTVEQQDGEYRIVADMVIADGEGSRIRGTFEGSLEFEDLTDGYIHFDSDMNEVMTGHSGGIYPGDGMYNDYTMTFYSVPLDEDGWILGAGYIFNTELFFDVAGGDYSGTYYPNPDWENGYANYTYLPGFVMDYYGMKMPVGTYLSEYDESGSMVRIGMVVDGDMDVSIKDGVLKMSGVFTTDKGHEITVSYEGPENLTDMTEGMSTSSMTVKPAPKPAEKAAVSGWRAL